MQTRKIIMDPFVKKLLIWKLYKKTKIISSVKPYKWKPYKVHAHCTV
mgnify:CR=1 FL=1